MTAPRIHTQLGTTIDPDQKDSEMNHTIDSETTHRKDMKIHMDKGTNHKKETLHILGKEIITEKEKETHLNQEDTAITGPQKIKKQKTKNQKNEKSKNEKSKNQKIKKSKKQKIKK